MKPKLFAFCVIVLTVLTTLGWSEVNVPQSTFFYWLFSFAALYFVFRAAPNTYTLLEKFDRRLLVVYLVWLAIGVVRGIFIAENYWEWKALISTTTTLLLPALAYVFVHPILVRRTFGPWFKWMTPLFFILFVWIVRTEAWHFCFMPFFVFGILLPWIPRPWRWAFVVIVGVALFIAIDARSQVVKAALMYLLAIGFYLRKIIPMWLLKLGMWVCFIFPVVFLWLGLSGTYNIFADNEVTNQGKIVSERVVDGELKEEDAASDTRSFLYEEIVTSALRHDYVLFGRSPARGNDSEYFGEFNAEELQTGKYERQRNEFVFPDVFTWLGLVGMVMYILFYLRAAWLAIYRSHSKAMKFVGIFIAFHWLYGWVEDWNAFDIGNLTLWAAICIGLSKEFRSLTDEQMRAWLRSLFVKRRKYGAGRHM